MDVAAVALARVPDGMDFADAAPRVAIDAPLVFRYGRAIGDAALVERIGDLRARLAALGADIDLPEGDDDREEQRRRDPQPDGYCAASHACTSRVTGPTRYSQWSIARTGPASVM